MNLVVYVGRILLYLVKLLRWILLIPYFLLSLILNLLFSVCPETDSDGKGFFMFKNTRADVAAVLERDPAAKSFFEVYFLYPGVKALRYHRAAHFFWNKKMNFIAKGISFYARRITGIEIHPGATMGKGIVIDHGMGVVIGETAVVGDGCTIYQNVTLGGTGKDTGKRHPTIGKNVMIGSGAKVLGPFTVGDHSKIAANSVVLSEVPPNSTCVGAPARVVKINDKRVHDTAWELDQTHIPDPVSQELCKLMLRIEKLEKKAEKTEENKKTEKPEEDNL